MKPTTIIIHHSVSSRDSTALRDIDRWHRLRWPGFVSSLGYHIGYHYVIIGNGNVYKTRQENEIGAHCVPNEGKVGICLTGNFEEETPSPAQLNSLGDLLQKIKKEYNLADENIFGHCEKSRTLCPGKNLMKWLNLYRQVSLLKKIIARLLKLLKVGKNIK